MTGIDERDKNGAFFHGIDHVQCGRLDGEDDIVFVQAGSGQGGAGIEDQRSGFAGCPEGGHLSLAHDIAYLCAQPDPFGGIA